MRVSGRNLPKLRLCSEPGTILHELDVVAVGIVDVKAAVAVLHGFELLRHFDAAAGQVGAHLLGVGGFERYMGQPVHLGIGQLGKHFDVLVVVDLEIGQQQAGAFAGRLVQAEGLLEAQNSGVELASRRQIVRLQSDVGDADDRGTRHRSRRILGQRRSGQKGSEANAARLGPTIVGFMDRDSAAVAAGLSRRCRRCNVR